MGVKGAPNGDWTKAVRSVATDTRAIGIRDHAYDRMEERGVDLDDVYTCLRKGVAHDPYTENEETRLHVTHDGVKVLVVVTLLDVTAGQWATLSRVSVVTVWRLDS